MNIPDNLKYTSSHEWISEPKEGIVTIGITDFAQDQLGDVVFVELPEVGSRVAANDAVAVVESVKTASDIYTPAAGEVVAVNEALEETPETINTSPYDTGWIFRLRLTSPTELGGLLDASAYLQHLEEE